MGPHARRRVRFDRASRRQGLRRFSVGGPLGSLSRSSLDFPNAFRKGGAVFPGVAPSVDSDCWSEIR